VTASQNNPQEEFLRGLTAALTPAKRVSTVTKLSNLEIEGVLKLMNCTRGDFLKWMMDNDVPCGLGYIGWRPHKIYDMGSMAALTSGGTTGFTYWMRPDFQLTDDVNKKMHFGHFTMYAKSVILNEEYIAHARNIFSRAYIGGNGGRIWDPLDRDDVVEYNQGHLEKDIFLMPCLSNYVADDFHMDISGRYHESLNVSDACQESTNYEAAAIFSKVWGFRNARNYTNERQNYMAHVPRNQNTLCFQEHQTSWNASERKWDCRFIDKGHWGMNVYPGCAQVRRNALKHLQATNYNGTMNVSITPAMS
jgi:hypothetical protein